MVTYRLDDGFSTVISFSVSAAVRFYEKTVTPPGIEAGGPIDTTTMHNTQWRTNWPKSLKTLSEMSLEVAYNVLVYDDILAMIAQVQLITIHFPDGQVMSFNGWLDSFVPGALKEGEQPVATVKIIPSNQDATKTETNPAIT